ncbi:MAG: GntR family transcriptional regulator [Bacteroidota bacterium]|nr:GntR family transcriptional regulator [Bacteroidota bacterium]
MDLQYKRIYDILKKDISIGKYEVGTLLPSENDLTAEHKVARSTIRLALAQLEKEGIIFKHKGKGSIVKSQRKSLGLLSFKGFSESVTEAKSKITTIVIDKTQLAAIPSNVVFGLTKREKSADAFYFGRVRKIDNVPVMIEYTWLPSDGLKKFDQLFNPENSLFDLLHQKYKIEVEDMYQDINAINANPEIANLLEIKEGEALLLIHRKYFTSKLNFCFYSTLYCNTNKFSFSNYKPTFYNSEQ